MSKKEIKKVNKTENVDFAKTVGNILLTVYFFSLLVYMYYQRGNVIETVVYIEKGHLCALVIVLSAFIYFLFTANYSRFMVSLKSAVVYSSPLILMTIVSFFIWVVTKADVDAIKRGLSGSFLYTNLISTTLAMAALLLVFGEEAIWINFYAMVCAHCYIIFEIWQAGGVGTYMRELITLITSFSTVTGEVIIEAEQHELVFCIGAYLIYFILYPPKGLLKWFAFAVSMFLFVSGLKRIAIISIALVLAMCIPLKFIAKKNEKAAQVFINVALTVTVIVLIAYVGAIRGGLFEYLEENGIDTMGRSMIYRALNKYYEFSPLYLGNGMGNLVWVINTKLQGFSVQVPHNDFLLYFADLGFIGYALWLIQLTFTRTNFFGRNKNIEGRILAFALVMYVIFVSLTDNTFEYMLIMGVVGLLMMSKGYEHNVRVDEMSRYGTILPVNLGEANIDDYR